MKHLPPPAAAAPAADPSDSDLTFADLAADPEIAPLLDFVPVPRQTRRANGWTDDLQRMFIAWLALYGSPGMACDELGMARSGVDKLFKSRGSDSFREAWAAAIAIAQRRRAAGLVDGHVRVASFAIPQIDHRRRARGGGADGDDSGRAPAPGMVRNENGEWEDEGSYFRRGEEARDSITNKLLRCRRLYLLEISGDPAKRAAFEILTQLPIDWGKAARWEAQDDEPWRVPNMRTPEMLLTGENGWLGDLAHGPDKRDELLRAINRWRAQKGLAPLDMSESSESNDGA